MRISDWSSDVCSSDLERIHEPGSTPAYSNYATAVAGYIVERVSGESFDDYIDRHIFQPLGMAHSSFSQPLPPALLAKMSKGYSKASDAETKADRKSVVEETRG